MKPLWAIAALVLTACSGSGEESDAASIANQAESLERAANATVDQQIGEIEAEAAAEAPAIEVVETLGNKAGE